MVSEPRLTGYAENNLEFISKYLKHPIYSGYWNRSTTNGTVTMDAVSSYYVGTYHAVAALFLLGGTAGDEDKCREWISKHQNPDGEFARVIGTPSDTTDEGFTGLQTMYILEKALSPYWVAMIN